MKTKGIKILMWICISLLTLQFLGAGVTKLLGGWSSKFIAWGYSSTFVYTIGSLEIIGVVGLFLPKARKWSAILLTFIMVGAAYTHLSYSEPVRVVHNGIITGLLLLVIRLDQKLR
jgi:uncharacterized membrane protein YphA (DoxX/SURF4 family)